MRISSCWQRRYTMSTQKDYLNIIGSDCAEVRILRSDRYFKGKFVGNTISGYYDTDHFDNIQNDISQYDQDVGTKAIYTTIHKVNKACLSRAKNRLKTNAETTTNDNDVTHFLTFPIDIDPPRPAGVSSTEAELSEAKEKGKAIAAELETLGLACLKAMSGNGIHIVVVLNPLENTQENAEAFKFLGDRAANYWDTDTTIYNPSRIWKLYGTISRKGDNTDDRPHRKSTVHIPEDIERYDFDDLRTKLDTILPPAEKQQKETHNRRPPTSPKKHKAQTDKTLREFLDEHGIQHRDGKAYDGGTKYQLDCPFNPAHKAPDAFVSDTGPGRSWVFSCSHNSCASKNWHDFRAVVAPKTERTQQKAQKAQGTEKQPAEDDNPYYIGKKFSPYLLGEDVCNDLTIISHNDELFVYQPEKGIYENDTGDVESSIREKHGATTTTHHVNETKAYILNQQRVVIPEENTNLIPFKNGVLDFDTFTLNNHSPQNYLFSHYPVEWDEAHNPHFDEFLTEIVPADAVNLVYEMIGAIFHRESFRMQNSFLLIGGGANGKSLLLKIVDEMVGSENICSYDWTTLDERFAMANLYNKAAAICTDLNTAGFIPREVKKAITGDRVESDQKNTTSIKFIPTCIWIACANEMPRTKDKTPGFYRRFVPISFPNTFKADPNFENQLLTRCREEHSGILYTALAAYKQARQRGGFTSPETTEDLKVSLREASDTIKAFIDSSLVFTDSTLDTVSRTEIRDAYIEFCESEGYQPDKKYPNLYTALRNAGAKDVPGQISIKGRRDRHVSNVKFT